MRKRIFLALVALLLALSAATLHASTSPRRTLKRLHLPEQETASWYRYTLRLFGVIPAGTVTFFRETAASYAGRDCLKLTAAAQNLPALDRIFAFSAQLESYVERERLAPLVFRQTVRMRSKPDATKEVFYDQEAGTMRIGAVTRTIPQDTHDPLSLLRRFRTMDMDSNRSFDFTLNTNQKNYAVAGTLEKMPRDEGKIGLYRADASIFRRDKNRYHRSRVSIVFLDRHENIPVVIKVFASGFFLTATLSAAGPA